MLAGIEWQAHGVGRLQQVRRAAIGGEGVHGPQREGDAFACGYQPLDGSGRKRDGAGRLFKHDPPKWKAATHGYVVVSVTDIMQMFRRCGTGPTKSVLRRIRPKDQDEWIMMMDPATGIEVTLADLLIMADDVRRFETEFDLLRRPASNIGSTARYDWDGMYITLMVRIHEEGLPATQAEWLGEVQEWFVATSESGEVPDERTIRRRLTPIWKALRGS